MVVTPVKIRGQEKEPRWIDRCRRQLTKVGAAPGPAALALLAPGQCSLLPGFVSLNPSFPRHPLSEKPL